MQEIIRHSIYVIYIPEDHSTVLLAFGIQTKLVH